MVLRRAAFFSVFPIGFMGSCAATGVPSECDVHLTQCMLLPWILLLAVLVVVLMGVVYKGKHKIEQHHDHLHDPRYTGRYNR